MRMRVNFRNTIFRSGTVVLSGFFLANVLNYLFTLVIARFLLPSQFGDVVTLLGLLFIVSVPAISLQTLVAKYTAFYKSQRKTYPLSKLYMFILSAVFIAGIVFFLFIWATASVTSVFFHINKTPLLFFGFLPFVLLLYEFISAILQGFEYFYLFAFLPVIVAMVKLSLAIFFVLSGFAVSGVIAAIVVGYLSAFLFGFLVMKSRVRLYRKNLRFVSRTRQLLNNKLTHLPKYLIRKSWNEWYMMRGFYHKFSTEKDAAGVIRLNFISYSQIILLTSLIFALFANIDIVLTKHFLASFSAGQYAALVVAGKLIINSANAFIAVMFPKVVSSFVSQKTITNYYLFSTLIAVLILSVVILMVFFLMPGVVLNVLFGTKYQSVAYLLFWFGLASMFTALSSVFINFFLASHAKQFIYILGGAMIFRTIIIVLFHQSIFAITIGVLTSSFVLFTGLAVVYLRIQYWQTN